MVNIDINISYKGFCMLFKKYMFFMVLALSSGLCSSDSDDDFGYYADEDIEVAGLTNAFGQTAIEFSGRKSCLALPSIQEGSESDDEGGLNLPGASLSLTRSKTPLSATLIDQANRRKVKVVRKNSSIGVQGLKIDLEAIRITPTTTAVVFTPTGRDSASQSNSFLMSDKPQEKRKASFDQDKSNVFDEVVYVKQSKKSSILVFPRDLANFAVGTVVAKEKTKNK